MPLKGCQAGSMMLIALFICLTAKVAYSQNRTADMADLQDALVRLTRVPWEQL